MNGIVSLMGGRHIPERNIPCLASPIWLHYLMIPIRNLLSIRSAQSVPPHLIAIDILATGLTKRMDLAESDRQTLLQTQQYHPFNQDPTLRGALNFVDRVKARFKDRPELWEKFEDILMESHNQNIEIPDVEERILELFDGQPDLMQGISVFLPSRHRLEDSTGEGDENTDKDPDVSSTLHTPDLDLDKTCHNHNESEDETMSAASATTTQASKATAGSTSTPARPPPKPRISTHSFLDPIPD